MHAVVQRLAAPGNENVEGSKGEKTRQICVYSDVHSRCVQSTKIVSNFLESFIDTQPFDVHDTILRISESLTS